MVRQAHHDNFFCLLIRPLFYVDGYKLIKFETIVNFHTPVSCMLIFLSASQKCIGHFTNKQNIKMKKLLTTAITLFFFYGGLLAQQGKIILDGIPYKPVIFFEDGSNMSDANTDGVIYKKIKGKFYKRVYDGAIKTSWYGAAGDGRTDDSKAVQKAITWCVENKKNLEVDGMHLIRTSLVIDRKVDSSKFYEYFILSSNSGGGFVTDTAIPIFTSSIPFTGSPVSQLVNFRDITFRTTDNNLASFVLDSSKFLRIQFVNCSFNGIKLLNANKYVQTIYLTNCNIRNFKGYFFKCMSNTYDFKMIGCIAEHGDGTCLYLTNPTGCSIQSSLIEGMKGTAITFNGSRGINISGNYFEGNEEADIRCDVKALCRGVAIIGNLFANINKTGNLYSIYWGPTVGAVSYGNDAMTNLHFLSDKTDVDIKDSAKNKLTNRDESKPDSVNVVIP